MNVINSESADCGKVSVGNNIDCLWAPDIDNNLQPMNEFNFQSDHIFHVNKCNMCKAIKS